VTKNNQNQTARTPKTGEPPATASVPQVVSVAMNEIAADVREGLLALAVGAGLQVLTAMMAADVDALCGPKGRHDADLQTRSGARQRADLR
jgi:putative transposase